MKPASRRPFHAARGCMPIAAALLVAGCAVGPDFHAPDAPATQRYTRGEPPATTASAAGPAGDAQTFASAAHTPQHW